jgi:hypothetical protein
MAGAFSAKRGNSEEKYIQKRKTTEKIL